MQPKKQADRYQDVFEKLMETTFGLLWEDEDEDNTHSSIELVDSTTDIEEREFCGETTEDAEFEIIS